jgi:threonine aldolase
LAGNRAFIERAIRFRKQFGGGMRQAGIIAAGALYALKYHRERLVEDHEKARRLAEGIASIPGLEIDLSTVETNIVIFHTVSRSAPELVRKFLAEGLTMNVLAADAIRAVTHLDVSCADIDRAVEIMRGVMGEMEAG